MGTYSKAVWLQLKNIPIEKLVKALEKDGWIFDSSVGAKRVYLKLKDKRRITIHYHPKKTYGQGLLKALLDDIEWSEVDMKKLKLIK